MTYKDNYLKVRNTLALILGLNILVALAKLIYGLMTKTSSMIADGFHSFSDGASNVVGLIGIWIASKPADENHPYGHHKVETLSTIVISFALFIVSFKILVNSYNRFMNPVVPKINVFSFIVMILTLIINILVVRYESKKGKELNSSILISDSKHTESDIYVSISVIVSLIAIKLGYIFIDTLISAIIAILICRAGIQILREGINVLIDGKMIEAEKIHKIVMEIEEVIYCHKIRTRGKQNHIMIDLHVGIDKNHNIDYCHKLSHRIEDTLKKDILGVEEVIVHIEPASEDNTHT
ncbi:cation diffusion facilitator family transporter [Gottschalkia purinilytica]|uniref:Cation diffusion facilitator family transporter n=1 Tax=Gottschalkia purinilytica TaxID=1503 RepID=A0A0L0WCK3_GOTPU|nr:cation diffusion facilitator family transporter [Gottschalkia purinilytica]KNF09197.1 cation diffusion facilitator family transporter [Gottschalkia purinilytica]